MNSGLPLYPLYMADLVGALLMIVLSLCAFTYARRLTRLEPKSVLWAYLFWLSMALVAFAISRSAGHVLRFVFILSGRQDLWTALAPFSGGMNSLIFVAAAILTFYYNTMHSVIVRIRADAEALQNANENLLAAHEALHILNHTLEERVEERTRELRLSEQKFRHLFEGSRDMIYFCDSRGNITDINDAGIELLGQRSKGDIVGRPLAHFFAVPGKWNQYFAELSRSGHVKDFEIEVRSKDGVPLYFMLTASAIRNEKGKILGCEGIAKDLTRFREVTNQLILSEKMASMGQLAAGVAHEINTPLGIILGYCQLLEEDLADRPEMLDILKIMEKQTKTCKRIVADLLKFSRHSAEESRAPADINQCVEEVLTIMAHTISVDGITIERHLGADLPAVVLNTEKIRQVLVNLITNAHHAIGRNGVIGIWTGQKDREVEIIIADTGPGIPAAIIGQIFDPFFTTKGVGKGTGMGLAVSFGIIKEHGGRLEAHSPPADAELYRAGMRTAFHISLPLTTGEPTVNTKEPEPQLPCAADQHAAR